MLRPPVPPAPATGAAVPAPVPTLQMGSATLDMARPHIVLRADPRSDVAADPAVRRADVVALPMDLSTGPAEARRSVEAAASTGVPVLVVDAGPVALEASLEAGAAGAIASGGSDLGAMAPVLAEAGAILLLVGRPPSGALLGSLPADRVVVEAGGEPAPDSGAALPLLVVDRCVGAAGQPGHGGAATDIARRVAALTLGVHRGGRLLLTDEPTVARRVAAVVGAIIGAEQAEEDR